MLHDNSFVLPTRQLILLGLTVTIGIYLFIAYQQELIAQNALARYISFYSVGIPLVLLLTNALIDLNDIRIFFIWLLIGSILLIFYFTHRDNPYFHFERSPKFDTNIWLNSFISETRASSFKTLFCFLIAYQLFNRLMRELTGNFILNTNRHHAWFHNKVKRKFTVWDIVFNILLFLVILFASFY